MVPIINPTTIKVEPVNLFCHNIFLGSASKVFDISARVTYPAITSRSITINVAVKIMQVDSLRAVKSINNGISARKNTVPLILVKFTKKPCKRAFIGLKVKLP